MSTGTGTSFQRARRPEQKERRRQDILAAASTLGARDGVRAVTLTDMAAEAGVHKSAVLRYFETREAVFLMLTAEAWQEWAAAVDDALCGSTRTGPGDPVPMTAAREQGGEALRQPTESADVEDEVANQAAGAPTNRAAGALTHQVAGTRTDQQPEARTDQVAGVLAGTLAERPLFCDLLAHAPLHLERGVSEEEVRGFKLTTLDAVDRIVRALRTALPGLTGTQAVDLVASVTAMAAALWQTANPPETLARLYAQDPRLGHAAVEFTPRLKRMTVMLLNGATADRYA